MLQTIRLETKDGGFVRNALIPKFLPGQSPEVVIWGNRVFVQQEMMEIYREVTYYPIIDPPEEDIPF